MRANCIQTTHDLFRELLGKIESLFHKQFKTKSIKEWGDGHIKEIQAFIEFSLEKGMDDPKPVRKTFIEKKVDGIPGRPILLEGVYDRVKFCKKIKKSNDGYVHWEYLNWISVTTLKRMFGLLDYDKDYDTMQKNILATAIGYGSLVKWSKGKKKKKK